MIQVKLEDLRNRHDGETIWVLGSGPSLNFLDPTFFAGKIAVSTNYSAKTLGFKPQYAFTHYPVSYTHLTLPTKRIV